MSKARIAKGWFEHYQCGCVSEVVNHKKDLFGYCPQHGMDRKQIYPCPIEVKERKK